MNGLQADKQTNLTKGKRNSIGRKESGQTGNIGIMSDYRKINA